MNQTVLVISDAELPSAWIDALVRNGFLVKRQPSAGCDAGAILVRLDEIRNLSELVKSASTPLILIRPSASSDLAALARAVGVTDYLREPISPEELVASVKDCLSGAAAPGLRRQTLVGGERLVGRSAGMDLVRAQLAGIASTECNVLITGETGTGKELAAELIHLNGARSARNFVCLNCAAIPEPLLESELFGYEKGSFTGAHSARPGQLEVADGGTLFLDEIGEMSLAAQAKILRAIDSKEIQRLGRRSGIRVDVRIICATNRDLEAEVEKGTFRADLHFRLNVARLRLPPLRERKEDIPELVSHFLSHLNGRMGRQVTGFTECSWQSLLRHEWPGNVRELRNAVETSLVHLPYSRMRLMELPADFRQRVATASPTESEQLLAALVTHNWNKSKAAQQLRWSRMRVYRKMAQYQLPATQESGQKGA